jgi:hypothetical protein
MRFWACAGSERTKLKKNKVPKKGWEYHVHFLTADLPLHLIKVTDTIFRNSALRNPNQATSGGIKRHHAVVHIRKFSFIPCPQGLCEIKAKPKDSSVHFTTKVNCALTGLSDVLELVAVTVMV